MKELNLDINNVSAIKEISVLGNALASPIRVKILQNIKNNGESITNLAKQCYVSFSSIMFHLKLLQEADLIKIVVVEKNNRKQRVVTRAKNFIYLNLCQPIEKSNTLLTYQSSQIVGGYIEAKFGTISGIVTPNNAINIYGNEPFLKERFDALLIYTNYGFVTYAFDNNVFKNKSVKEITFRLEICSETSFYNNNYKSDITFSINGIEVGTFTSPGDFGGRKGIYTTINWGLDASQYGQLKSITVNELGTYIDGILINDSIKINQLNLNEDNKVTFKVESKENAKNKGGFNIFGKNFGDYNQDIEMSVKYEG